MGCLVVTLKSSHELSPMATRIWFCCVSEISQSELNCVLSMIEITSFNKKNIEWNILDFLSENKKLYFKTLGTIRNIKKINLYLSVY